MKNNLLILVVSVIIQVTISYGQSTTNTSTLTSHPTIENIKVIYKSAINSNTTSSSPGSFFAIPIATVTLKDPASVSKIYFNITDVTSDSLLYSSNYLISSPTVTTSTGIKLFDYSNGLVFLSSAEIRTLKPYKYKILTEDSLQNQSPLFIKIQ